MSPRNPLRLAAAALVGIALAGGAFAALAAGDAPGRSPDPPGTASRKQWVFDVRYANRHPTIERVRSASSDQPIATARVMGRFAIELYVGHELLDRVRFNVPLTADPPDPAHQRQFHRPTFENVTTHVRVTMADAPRAAWGILVDRFTGEEQRFWWPPEADGHLTPMAPPKHEPPPTDGDAGPRGAPDAGAPAPGADGGR